MISYKSYKSVLTIYKKRNSLLVLVFIFISFHILSANIFAQYKIEPAFPFLQPFSTPVTVTHSDDNTNRLYTAQLKGIIYVFDNSPTVNSRKVFLNLGSKLLNLGPQEGLLGLAFHPDFANNPYFYVHYVFDSTGSPVRKWIRVSRFTVSPSNPDSALFDSERILFTVSLPDRNHNGGQLAFGPDRKLYISLGDGYAGGDVSQDKTKLLGKILRVDPDSSSGSLNYSIPTDNPFYGNSFGWREEIFAYGFRNPWKFSFDSISGRIWLGDVGQYRYEEINILESGKNYGWNKMEGSHCYPDTTLCDTAGRNFTLPVWEYTHVNTSLPYAVVCGKVYRGTLLPQLSGKLLFGDFAQGNIQTLTYDSINPVSAETLADTNLNFTSFDADQNNEPLIVEYSNTNARIFRLRYSGPLVLDIKLIIEGYFNEIENVLNKRDSVTVYLHNSVFPFEKIDSASAIIDSTTFSGSFNFYNAPNGNYFIRVKHKNILETWSNEEGVDLVKGIINNYDFTDSKNKTLGNRSKIIGTKYCLISGDVNQDGVINALDRALVVSSNGSSENSANDIDGNGFVDNADRDILIVNIGNTKREP